MGCGCNNNNNKKLKLDDMRNKSIDDILKLYRDGYRLEGGIRIPQSYGTKTLQSYGAKISQSYGTKTLKNIHRSNIRDINKSNIKNIHKSNTRNMHELNIRNINRSNIRNIYRPSIRYTRRSNIRNMYKSNIINMYGGFANIYSMQNNANTITIVNPPSAVPGQSVTFAIRYDLNVDWYGEWVKFRICYNGAEIGGSYPTLLFGHSVGNINVSATFPVSISGTIGIMAEVTINELSWTCGDPDVIASTITNVPVITQGTNTISLLNPPDSVKPGWTVDLQISYNLTVSGHGELVRFRICSGGNEIGSNNELLFGNATGVVTVGATIPADASGTISILAEVTTNELSWTCGDADVVTTDGPINVTIGTINTISLINTPQSVTSGRTIDFTINYSLTVSNFGEWVRFRICSGGNEIGSNIELLYGNATGVITVTTEISPNAIGTISILAEVTTSELSSTCGEDIVTTDGPVNIPIIPGNTINITNPPAQVYAGETIDLTISYNLTVSVFGEWVKFRICDGTGAQISSTISLLSGNATGNVTINTQIPPTAASIISLKAEVTINELSSTCGDSDVIALMIPINIPVAGSVNSLTITNMPTTVSSGQEIIFTLDYNLPSIVSLPEIVRFRICANGIEIGNNIETLVFNTGGSLTVTATIPNNATNSILLKAEVTIDELNNICGDPDVVAKTSDISIPVYGTALPIATHYIEYDLSFLPTWFLDLMIENIQWISDTIGPYLPLSGDVEYVRSEYINTDAKLRIYVKYVPSLSPQISVPGLGLPNDILDLNTTYCYNSTTGRIETVAIPTALSSAAEFIAGILIFVICSRIAKANPSLVIASALVGIIGAILIGFAIVDLINMMTTSGEAPPLTPKQKIENIQQYYNEYLKVSCEELYPDCVTIPPTCDTGTMRAYVGCIGGEKYAQCMHARAAAGDPEGSCEQIKTQIIEIDTCLANNSCTVEEAKTMLDSVVANVDTIVEDKLAQVTCQPDYTYDPEKQLCVPGEQCAIRNPFGGCILSQGTASGIMMIGGLLVVGVVMMKTSPGSKSAGRYM